MKTIFLVDDDKSTLKMFSIYAELALPDYALQVFLSGISAIEEFQKNQPDIVITDFNMPEINGYNLAKELRRISSSIKIIMQTGDLNDPFIPKDVFEFIDVLLWKGNSPEILAKTSKDLIEEA